MSVIKRDGDIVSFDANKIISAINKAFIEVDGKLYENDTATDIALEIGKKVLRYTTYIAIVLLPSLATGLYEFLLANTDDIC